MKKIFSYLAAILLLGGFLFPLASFAGVEGQYLDQKNENVAAAVSMAEVGNYSQSFIPTVTKITSIELYLKNQTVGEKLSVTLTKYDGTVVAPATESTPFIQKDGWVTIAYDSPFVSVTPTYRYLIQPKIVGAGKTDWPWTGGNLYTHGEASGMTNSDFLFRVYGTKLAGTTGATTTPNASATTKVVTPETAAPVDVTIVKPVLLRYDINNKSYSGPFGKVVELKRGDKLTLVGTSFPGAKVTVYLGEKPYVADIVSSGSWVADIPASDIKEGTQTITAQSLSGSKGSEVAEMLKINIPVEKTEVKEEEKEGLLLSILTNPWVLAGLGLLLIILVILLVFLERKYHGLSKIFKKKEVTKEANK
jgi:hypothetical protein